MAQEAGLEGQAVRQEGPPWARPLESMAIGGHGQWKALALGARSLEGRDMGAWPRGGHDLWAWPQEGMTFGAWPLGA